MKIINITPRPCHDTLEPSIRLEMQFASELGAEIPVGWAVNLLTPDQVILAEGTFDPGWDQTELATQMPGPTTPTTLYANCRFRLSPKALDKIEALRARHLKGNVELRIAITCTLLKPNMYNATFFLGQGVSKGSNGQDRRQVLYESPSGTYHHDIGNLWVLSGASGRAFMVQKVVKLDLPMAIHSSDWLHDFASHFRSTSYLVVELPRPDVSDAKHGLPRDKVDAAIQAVRKAEISFSKGEWSDVVEDLRPVWELIRNDKALEDMLVADGYPQDAIQSLNSAVKALFDFASKFMHRLDKTGKNVTPEIKAMKEEATLCYSCAMAILNALTRKAARALPS